MKSLLKSFLKKIFKVLFLKIYHKIKIHKPTINTLYHHLLNEKVIRLEGKFLLGEYSKFVANPAARLDGHDITIERCSQLNLYDPSSRLTVGKNTILKSYCSISIWNANVIIGDNVLFNNYCSMSAGCEIEIGNNTWFGEGVRFYDHNHKYKDSKVSFIEQGYSKGKINIGENCWIGCNCVILQNVTIGNNCVIGANNLIYKSIPDNTIVKAKAMEIVQQIER